MLSHFSCLQLLETKRTVACRAPLSMGILQARILEWLAVPFPRGSSQPRDRTQVSRIADGFFIVWPTREALNISNKLNYQDVYCEGIESN